MPFDKQEIFRRLLKTRAFTRLYGRVIGAASAQMFADPLKRELLDHLPLHARVLEVGCGPGLQAIELARLRPDLDITASDFSAEFIRLGQANAARARSSERPEPASRINFVVADAMDLSCFAPASFDGVYSLTAIKHFPDPVRGLRECLRVLKPGGRLIVAEISRESSRAQVRTLVELFRVPRWLKGLLTRLVHGNLREECPRMTDVERWLMETGVPVRCTVLRAPTDLPAWMATIRPESAVPVA